jgi:hypothetical protein
LSLRDPNMITFDELRSLTSGISRSAPTFIALSAACRVGRLGNTPWLSLRDATIH